MVLIYISCKSAQTLVSDSFPVQIKSPSLFCMLTPARWWTLISVKCTHGFDSTRTVWTLARGARSETRMSSTAQLYPGQDLSPLKDQRFLFLGPAGPGWPGHPQSWVSTTLLLTSLTCLAARHHGCLTLWGSRALRGFVCLQGDGMMLHVSAIPKSSTNKCIRHWLEKQEKRYAAPKSFSKSPAALCLSFPRFCLFKLMVWSLSLRVCTVPSTEGAWFCFKFWNVSIMQTVTLLCQCFNCQDPWGFSAYP